MYYTWSYNNEIQVISSLELYRDVGDIVEQFEPYNPPK